MKNFLDKAKALAERDVLRELDMMNTVIDTVELSKEYDFLSRRSAKVPGKKTGVYFIIHKPSGKIMSIGQGIVSNRLHRHWQVFNNDGRDIVYESGATSPSVTGQKMFKYDPDSYNWSFKYIIVGDKDVAINKRVANKLELILQQEHKPEFNAEHMAGVN